jgi:hypothetical protein
LKQGVFVILFLIFVVVQSPWIFVLDRYLMPATIGIVIFIGLEIAGIRDMLLIQKNRWTPWLAITFSAFLLIFIIVNTIQIYNYGEGYVHQTRFIQYLYSDLAKSVPPNGIVLMNFLKGDSTAELVSETGIHLDLLYHRPDIQVGYLNLDNLPKGDFIIVGTFQIRAEYPRQAVEESIGKYRKDESLVLEDRYFVLTTPIELFKQVIKKLYKLVVLKMPFTSDGIYTFANPRDIWSRYYVGK